MKFEIFPTPAAASKRLAVEISDLIRERAAGGLMVVLGLATGKSPLFLYRELVRMHREEGLSFANVVSFNLDEYCGLDPVKPQSYWTFMHENLFDHVDIRPENIHIPAGNISEWEVRPFCAAYEQAIDAAGGIDFQILGIGRTGHIGFNEPGAGRDSLTTLVHLDELTRKDAADDFGGLDKVPTSAITMGCGTILKAERIAMMAWGTKKADIVKEAFEGAVSDDVPASYLQDHADVTVYLDDAAASALESAIMPTEKHNVLRDKSGLSALSS